jgi:hypothetical protein
MRSSFSVKSNRKRSCKEYDMPTPLAWSRIVVTLGPLVLLGRANAEEKPASRGAQNPVAVSTETRPVEQPVSRSAGTDQQAPGNGAAVVDFDNDGFLDIFVTNLYQSGPTKPQPLSEYWIGVDGTSADAALRAQLEVPQGQGLLINQVVKDSPAARAGLKQYDLLLTCLDTPLAEIADLARIVEEKKETALPLKLIRGGKRIEIEVIPQRRPPSQTGETCPAVSKADDATFARRAWLDLVGVLPAPEAIEKFIVEKRDRKREWLVNRLLRKSTVAVKSCTACHANDGEEFKLCRNLPLARWETDVLKFEPAVGQNYIKRLVGLPGVMLDLKDGTFLDAGQKLPDDVSLSVTLQGSQPPKITVKKGDRTWEFTGALDQQQLPDELRACLAALMTPAHASAGANLFRAIGDVDRDGDLDRHPDALVNGRVLWNPAFRGVWHEVVTPGSPKAEPQPAASEAAFDRLDKQLDSFGSQLGELRKAMHDLHQTLKTERPKSGTEDKK